MKSIAKVYQPEDSSEIATISEETNEEDTKAAVKTSAKDKNSKVTTKDNEGLTKLMNFAPIAHFTRKLIKVKK